MPLCTNPLKLDGATVLQVWCQDNPISGTIMIHEDAFTQQAELRKHHGFGYNKVSYLE
jgi:hypothetical protein